MKIHSLEITGFGPFKDKQKIDFDELTADGLFMLEGPTGAGKSSIIDAIVWVLYGTTAHESAMSKATTTSGRVRSDYCGPDDETRVIMEFSVQGRRYRVQRTPTYITTKVRGEGDRTINSTARLEFLKPAAESLIQLVEVGARIRDILGMGREQFSKLVVLPQGDFATFLHSSSEERREVLQSIFKTYFYESIEEFLEAKRKEIESSLKDADTEITHHVRNLATEAGTSSETDFDQLAEILSDSNEEKNSKIEILESTCAGLTPDRKADDLEKKSLDARLKPLVSELNILNQSIKNIDEKAKLTLELEGLNDKKLEVAALEKSLTARSKVAHLGVVLENRVTAEFERDSALKKIDITYRKMTTAQIRSRIAILKPKLQLLNKQATEAEGLDQKFEDIQEKLSLCEEITDAKREVLSLDKKIPAQEAKIEALKKKIVAYQKNQKNGYAHLVAKVLKSGQPCPVCGSKEHPAPLKGKGEFDPEVLEKLQDNLSVLKEEFSALKSERTIANRTAIKKTRTKAALTTELRAVEKSLKNVESVTEDLETVNEELDDLQVIQEHSIERERADKALTKAKSRLADDMQESGVKSEDTLRELLELDVTQLTKKVDNHNKRVSEILAVLNQTEMKKLPAPGSLQARLDELKSEVEKYSDQQDDVNQRIAISDKKRENIETAHDGISKALDIIQELLSAGEPYLNLDKLVHGKNSQGITLTNFVLQERLELVLEHASIHLRRVSNGKYEFRLSEEKTGRQRRTGLGIKVMDYFAGKERPAETLSGGETFYASLALALGLAEVVKADQGGIELGTLFIDEGFGSLSDQTLGEVLDVLEDLRSADRIIGIISHVEGMKNQIPLRLEVRASEAGPSNVKLALAGME